MSGVAYRIGDPEREPLTTPLSRSDYWGAINAASATLAALFAREKDGLGQHVDISSTEALSTLIGVLSTIGFVETGVYPKRAGTRNKDIAYPWVILPCKDGFFSMITTSDRHWLRFVELMGSPDWSEDPRYQDRVAMGTEYPEEVDQFVRPFFATRTKAELWDTFRENRIPFHAVQRMDEVANCAHLDERGFFSEVDHPEAGRVKYPGGPGRYSETPWRLRRAAPTLGEHNAEIYCGWLNLGAGALVDLRRAGVI